MAQIPITYPIQPSEATASFDYADIQEGKGTTIYYGGVSDRAEISGSTTYTREFFLGTQASLRSDKISVGANANQDMDFDLTFNRPQNLKGSIFCNGNFGSRVTAGAPSTATSGSVVLRAYKVTGGTETEIGFGSTTPYTIAAGSVNQKFDFGFGISLSGSMTNTVTHFKKGDILRMNVITVNNNPDQYIMGIGTDPADREDDDTRVNGGGDGLFNTGHATQLSFQVPFVLKI